MAARRPKGRKGRKAPRRTTKKKKPAGRAAAKPAARKRAPAKRKTAATRKGAPAKRKTAATRKGAVTPKKTRGVAGKKAPAGSRRRSPASPRRGASPRERLAAGVPVEVGVVTHWFPRASAAVVRLSHPIHRGDTIHVRGQHTDFVQQVESLALEGEAVSEGLPSQDVGLRLAARVRRGDRVYRISW